jgi:transposase-like protein
VAKGQRRFEGFDQAIISLYSRGLTTREIEGHCAWVQDLFFLSAGI